MQRTVRTRHRRILLAAVAAAGLIVAGCGSDDEAATTTAAATTAAPPTTAAATTTKAPTTTTAATTTKTPATTAASPTTRAATTTAAPATNAAATDDYCDAAMAINTAGAASGDPEEDPVAFAQALLAPAKAAAAVAPAAIAPTYTGAVAALQAAVDGDPSKLGDVEQLAGQIDEFNVASCAWTKVPVTMESYHFVGIPETLPAGDFTFQLDNTATEIHVLVIVKKKDGVTESFDELLADPAGESKVETVVAGGAAPGDQANAFGHLEPGEYLALCPIPVGTLPGANEGTGPPHFTQGMHQVITVS